MNTRAYSHPTPNPNPNPNHSVSDVRAHLRDEFVKLDWYLMVHSQQTIGYSFKKDNVQGNEDNKKKQAIEAAKCGMF